MRKICLFITLYFVSYFANAQMIQVIDLDNSYIPTTTIDKVNIINENLDVSDIPVIARLECIYTNTGQETVVLLYKSLVDKAS